MATLTKPRPDVRDSDPETSLAAANGNHAKRVIARDRILEAFRKFPARGFTDDEMSQHLGDIPPTSAGKRRGDLLKRGLVMNSGRTRETRWGSPAIVWTITPDGQRRNTTS